MNRTENDTGHQEQSEPRYTSDVPGVFPDDLRLPFIEGMPSRDKVAAMRRWLLDHRDLYRNEYVILYHATGRAIPVLEQGLLPTSATRRRSYQSQSGYVYLAATPDRAKAFGDIGNGGNSRVYAVRVPVRRLKADTDQLSNQRSVGEAVGNSVAESVIYGGGARVKGSVSPYDIREVFLHPGHVWSAQPPAPESGARTGAELAAAARTAAEMVSRDTPAATRRTRARPR